MHIQLFKDKKHSKQNKKLQNILSYYVSRRDFSVVINILKNLERYTDDGVEINRYRNLFLLDPRVKEFFGLGEDIIGSMTKMVFGGDVTFKTEQKEIQEPLNLIYRNGNLVNDVIEAYKTATATNGKAYLFYDTKEFINELTEKVEKEELVKLTVEPEFNLGFKENEVIRTFVVYEKEHYLEFKYSYKFISDDSYILTIKGYQENGTELDNETVKSVLKIDDLVRYYDYRPYDVLDIGEGMLPNILHIENGLAENLFFQDEDLVNSQTMKYIPEDELLENALSQGDMQSSFNDKYSTTKIVNGGNIDARANLIEVVEGKSAIGFIERNLALTVIQACLDAKISPISIGYSLVEKMINNTDVGADKERVSIRLREYHIDKLKKFMINVLYRVLWFEGFVVDKVKLNVIFAQYITPSIESLTNTLIKQVQFGIKSREQAISELNNGIYTEEEIEIEIQRIMSMTTQFDFNADQTDKNRKGVDGVDNNLKSEK